MEEWRHWRNGGIGGMKALEKWRHWRNGGIGGMPVLEEKKGVLELRNERRCMKQ